MSNDSVIDVDFTENGEFYTLEDVAKMTGLSEAQISFYCSKLSNFLNIQSIGMYQIFSSSDIDNLNKIKELQTEKGMDLGSVKKYLESHKQEIIVKKEEDKINSSFLKFLERVFEYQDSKMREVFDLNQKVLDKLDEMSNRDKLLLEENTNKQRRIEETLVSKIDSLNNDLKEIKEQVKFAVASKEEIEKMSAKNKSWFSKLFK